MARQTPINQQLDILFDEPKEEHFVFSITYHCNTGHHDDCKGSKCYCLCHYRRTKTGRLVKVSANNIKEERRLAAESSWQALLEASKLPGEPDLTDAEKGFTCDCGIRTEYDSYVHANWSVELRFSCSCGNKYTLKSGVVTLIPKPAFVPKIRKK